MWPLLSLLEFGVEWRRTCTSLTSYFCLVSIRKCCDFIQSSDWNGCSSPRCCVPCHQTGGCWAGFLSTQPAPMFNVQPILAGLPCPRLGKAFFSFWYKAALLYQAAFAIVSHVIQLLQHSFFVLYIEIVYLNGPVLWSVSLIHNGSLLNDIYMNSLFCAAKTHLKVQR